MSLGAQHAPWAPEGEEAPYHLPTRPPRRRPAGPGVPNLTAMIDVVFLLMTYFLLMAQFNLAERAIDAAVPPTLDQGAAARAPFELPRAPVRVAVRSLGPGPGAYEITTDSPALAGPMLARELTARTRGNPSLPSEQRFVVTPAPGTAWEHALAAYHALRRAGFTLVRFAESGA